MRTGEESNPLSLPLEPLLKTIKLLMSLCQNQKAFHSSNISTCEMKSVENVGLNESRDPGDEQHQTSSKSVFTRAGSVSVEQ